MVEMREKRRRRDEIATFPAWRAAVQCSRLSRKRVRAGAGWGHLFVGCGPHNRSGACLETLGRVNCDAVPPPPPSLSWRMHRRGRHEESEKNKHRQKGRPPENREVEKERQIRIKSTDERSNEKEGWRGRKGKKLDG